MRILVTGSSGLIGTQLTSDLLKLDIEVYSAFHDNVPEYGIPTHLELTDPEEVSHIIQEIKPDIIIHSAALTNVDFCEKNPILANLVNTKATEIITNICNQNKVSLFYISTDYVFDGFKGTYDENTIPNPLCVYGQTKLKGEQYIQKHCLNYCIVRTSTPYGVHSIKESFPMFVINKLIKHESIQVVEDQFTSPTYIPNLSKIIIELILKNFSGIFHVSGKSRISRYELALSLAEKLHFDKNLIKPILSSKMNWKAKRPNDSSLNVNKINDMLTEKPLSIEEGLNSFITELELK